MMLATIVGAATVKSLLDHCTQHLLYIGTDGDIYEIAWKKVRVRLTRSVITETDSLARVAFLQCQQALEMS